MITEVLQGNILDSECQTLVNTVNTVGIMGKGVALEFKKRFPEMFKDYVRRCEVGEVVLGKPYLHRSLVPPWIINFPTKEHWRSVSRLDAIVDGLEYLSDHIEEWEVESLAVPPLGCGNGQLEWSVVGPTLFRWLEQLPIPVELYAPHEAPKEQLGREFLAFPGERSISADESRLEASWIALAAIVGKLDEARYSWPIGHTRWQKLAYFATAAGVPTRLEFEERPYGPFAVGLTAILSKLVNNGILVEQGKGRQIRIEPGNAYQDAIARFRDDLDALDAGVAKTVDLLRRLDPRSTEVAASAHFVAGTLGSSGSVSQKDVLDRVLEWKRRRKPPLDPKDVAIAVHELGSLDWLHLRPSEDMPVAPDSPELVA